LKLERFARITRDLETDQLFVFAFLKEQLRRDKLEGIPGKKACHYNNIYYQFIQYYHAYKGDDFMTKEATRHEKLTDLYLQFYLPFNEKGWPSSHAIVRPIDVAAKAILKDTLNLTEDEIKLEMIHALKSWLEIVHKGGATKKRTVLYGNLWTPFMRRFFWAMQRVNVVFLIAASIASKVVARQCSLSTIHLDASLRRKRPKSLTSKKFLHQMVPIKVLHV
jgi:hypothetical protein